jgi:DNA-binding NarL/FixJ family response regulator
VKPPADKQKSKVFIVDDLPLVREWLANLINPQSDLAICGEASEPGEALRLIAAAKPHVAVVDIAVAGAGDAEFIKNIKDACPALGIAVIVHSVEDDVLHLERALKAGARGYVTKKEATANLLHAIRCVLEGKLFLSNRWAGIRANGAGGESHADTYSQIARLSGRELEVFQLLGQWYGTRQIADQLNISYRTVQSFSARIKAKFKLSSSNELLREAVQWRESQLKK